MAKHKSEDWSNKRQKIWGGWTTEYLKPISLFLKGLSNSTHSTVCYTITLRSSQHKLESHCAWYSTKSKKKQPWNKKQTNKNSFFILSSFTYQAIKKTGISLKSEPEKIISQHSSRTGREPASLKFLTGICLGIRENLQLLVSEQFCLRKL